MAIEQVCVIGLGYVGLPTASLLASKGFNVHGVDSNPKIIQTIKQGRIPIQVADLDHVVRSAVRSSKLAVGDQPIRADVFILALPTPLKNGNEPDLSSVHDAAIRMAPYLSQGNLVILESTVPVGTTDDFARRLQALRPDLDIAVPGADRDSIRASQKVAVAHCPERVLPGQILKELMENDRVVGGIDKHSAVRAQSFYQKFVNGRVVATDARTAELCKLAENSFRDVNIAFANELSAVCEKLNVDIWELIRLCNRHPRVSILSPGPGVGGHCIPVDPWFIAYSAPEESKLIRAAREVNDAQPRRVVSRIRKVSARFGNAVIGCLGLAYKADIDDLRESPAVEIVRELAGDPDQTILVVEPYINELPPALSGLKSVRLAGLGEALQKSDVLALLVDHHPFLQIDPEILNKKVVLDTRGAWR